MKVFKSFFFFLTSVSFSLDFSEVGGFAGNWVSCEEALDGFCHSSLVIARSPLHGSLHH